MKEQRMMEPEIRRTTVLCVEAKDSVILKLLHFLLFARFKTFKVAHSSNEFLTWTNFRHFGTLAGDSLDTRILLYNVIIPRQLLSSGFLCQVRNLEVDPVD